MSGLPGKREKKTKQNKKKIPFYVLQKELSKLPKSKKSYFTVQGSCYQNVATFKLNEVLTLA